MLSCHSKLTQKPLGKGFHLRLIHLQHGAVIGQKPIGFILHIGNLRVDGAKEGERIQALLQAAENKDKGSIIMLIATDIPLSERQLKRVCKRAGVGLARTGSYYGNGSGDIAIAFTTANRVPHYSKSKIIPMAMMDDDAIDPVFRLTADAVEEAILSSMYHAKTTVGRKGYTRLGLAEYLK